MLPPSCTVLKVAAGGAPLALIEAPFEAMARMSSVGVCPRLGAVGGARVEPRLPVEVLVAVAVGVTPSSQQMAEGCLHGVAQHQPRSCDKQVMQCRGGEAGSCLLSSLCRQSVTPMLMQYTDAETWHADDVVKWLSVLGLTQYQTVFRDNEITGTHHNTPQHVALLRQPPLI